MSCVRGYIPSTILLACGFLSFALCSPAQAQDEWTQEDQSSSGGERSPRGIVLSDRHPVGAGETGVCVQQSGRVAKFLSGLFGTPTEQKEKEFALEAARDAHALGYNWVILSPLEATTGKRSFSSQQWVVVGTSYGIGTITDYIAPQWVTKSFTVRGYVMDCMALDDIAAYHLLFGDAEGVEATNPYKVYSVYDVDEALGPMVEGSGHRPLRRNPLFISSRRLQQPGQKERLSAQLAVMQDTERCMRAHVDAGAGSAAAVQQSADMEGMIECWTNLAPAAAQAGWDSFPLFTAMREVESEEAGYTRRSDMAGAEAPADKGFQWLEPKAAGGYRWSEGEVRFATGSEFSDSYLAYVASNKPLTADEMLDPLVFHASSYIMNSPYRYTAIEELEFPTDPQKDYGLRSSLWRELIALKQQYRTIRVFSLYPYTDKSNSVAQDFPVTAEKLQAYNVLGAKLFGSAFTPFERPAEY